MKEVLQTVPEDAVLESLLEFPKKCCHHVTIL